MQLLLSELIHYITELTEENVLELLDRYRAIGPLFGIFITFMKSFIPPLPTIVIVGANAAAFGLWPGFLYSWIGLVLGCMTAFLLVRQVASHKYIARMSERPKVKKGLLWIQNNAFSYVFVLSILPVGPFAIVNVVAGIAKMSVRSYLIAIISGKAIMVFIVSYFGYDIVRIIHHPEQLLYMVLIIGASLWLSKQIEIRVTKTK